MFDEHQYRILENFQSRTSITNSDQCLQILEHFHWNCLEAISFVLSNIDVQKPAMFKISPSVMAESSSYRHPSTLMNDMKNFIKLLPVHYSDVKRWPQWCDIPFDNVLLRSTGPFILFLNHDGSSVNETFIRCILCSSSILNLLSKYRCVIWPYDISDSTNKLRILETKTKLQSILVDCFSCITNTNEYPLLVMFRRQKEKIILCDIAHGHWDYHRIRSCLERVFNPSSDDFSLSSSEMTLISNGWIGGRTAGYIYRQESFITRFRLSRSCRATLLPDFVSFYKKQETIPDIILTPKEAQYILNKRMTLGSNSSSSSSLSSMSNEQKHNRQHITLNQDRLKSHLTQVDDQYFFSKMSRRRAGWWMHGYHRRC